MDPIVEALLAELEQQGATVTRGPRSTSAQLAAAERQLGFALPAEYREHLLAVGGITIERERTWRFYGLADALARTREYAAYLAEAVEDDGDDAYLPKRFLVLYDEGDHANAAAGTVYDADLEAMLVIEGARGGDRDEAVPMGYGALLCDALEEIRDRIADSPAPRGGLPDLGPAIEQLYAVFAAHPREQRRRRCAHDPDCSECKAVERALNDTALRALTTKQLEHYAYYFPPRDADQPDAGARAADYKHFLPRILELVDDIAQTGNPQVVLHRLLRSLDLLGLGADERRAVDQFWAAYWQALLRQPRAADLSIHDKGAVAAFLHAAQQAEHDIAPLLATWTTNLDGDAAALHAAVLVARRDFDQPAEYWGWNEPAFARLNAWLRSPALRHAFTARARIRGADPAYAEALETLAIYSE